MHEVMQQILGEFQAKQDLLHLKRDEAFESFAAYCVLHQFHEESFVPDNYRVGGGNDLGVDAYGIVINGDLYRDLEDVRREVEQSRELNVAIVVVQAKTTASFEGKVVAELADNLDKICSLRPIPYDVSDDVQEFQQCLQLIFTDLGKLTEGSPRLHVRYVTTGDQVADHIAKKCRSAEQTLDRLERFAEINVSCVTRRDLQRLYKRAETTVAVDFAMFSKSEYPKMPEIEQACFGLVPATEFVESVLTDGGRSIRKSLFTDNVRDFLGYKNKVNASIRGTLRDATRRQRFAVLNNGITIVTRQMRTAAQEIHIRDFQIVNGCQTCHVLFDCEPELTDNVYVQVTVIQPENEDVVSDIVVATNQQSDVTAENISAQEDFHTQLEVYFRSRPTPCHLYYERRANQYEGQGAVEKTRIVSQRRLAQAYAAVFLGESAGAGRYADLIKKHGGQLFGGNDHPIAYYAAASLMYRVEWLLRNGKVAAKFKPAKFLLMAAMRQRLVGGGRVPSKPQLVEKQCQTILDVSWDTARSERLVDDLLPTLEQLLGQHHTDKTLPRELPRRASFAKEFLDAISPTATLS